MGLECKNCCYFGYSYDRDGDYPEYEHCLFRELGHGDWETSPCDEDDDYEEDSYY